MTFPLSFSVLRVLFRQITNQYNGKSSYDISTVSLGVACMSSFGSSRISTMESLVMIFPLSVLVLQVLFRQITNQYNGKSSYDISTVSLGVACMSSFASSPISTMESPVMTFPLSFSVSRVLFRLITSQ